MAIKSSDLSSTLLAALSSRVAALENRVAELEQARLSLPATVAYSDDQLLTSRECAKLIGYSCWTLKYWRTHGTGGPPYCKKPGKRGAVRYRVSQVNKWLKRQQKTPIELG